eukprot:3472859-Amphidinium_carterae.1
MGISISGRGSGQCSLGVFIERVPLGRTPYTPQAMLGILEEMKGAMQAKTITGTEHNISDGPPDY